MTILVPTDFSELSKVAAVYAAGLAKRLKANIILLAVINPNSTSASSLNWKETELEMAKVAQDNAMEMIQRITKDIAAEVEITYRSMIGFPVEFIIETFAIQNAIDLIVMGTKGASGLKKIVLGSNAVAVVDNSSRPVIVVPGQTTFTQIGTIVYATDMVNHKEEIETIARVAGFFNADIKVLHVLAGDSAKNMDATQIAADLIKHANYPKISFHISRNDQIAEEIDNFVLAQKADMLAMFTHKLDFYEKLFGRSVTRQLAFHSHLPLLTFNKTTLL